VDRRSVVANPAILFLWVSVFGELTLLSAFLLKYFISIQKFFSSCEKYSAKIHFAEGLKKRVFLVNKHVFLVKKHESFSEKHVFIDEKKV
jgi:hypothetical protein